MSKDSSIDETSVDGDTNGTDDQKFVTQAAIESRHPHEGRLKNGTFGKGFSGNYNGRPKKMERAWSERQLDLDLLREANRLVSVHVDGKIQKITMNELMFRAVMTQAAKGDLKAYEVAQRTLSKAQQAHQRRNPGTFHWLEQAELEQDDPRMGTKEQFKDVLNLWRKSTRR